MHTSPMSVRSLYVTRAVHCMFVTRKLTDEPPRRIQALTISIDALSAAADVLISGSLVVLLRRARTGFKK
jgi:hypothetical protein